MRVSRLIPVAAAGALLVASIAPAQAQTDEVEGVGTTTGALTLLGIDAGSLLSIDVLSDAGLANIDEAFGGRSAAAQISALVVESPAAGISEAVPLLSVQSTGESEEAGQAVSPIDNPIISGSILPLSLQALVDELGATSQISAGLADLDVLGGILRLASTDLDLGSDALVGDAHGDRGITLDALTILDLEALLAGLGIPLTDLPLDSLLGLIDSLGLLGQLSDALAPLGLGLEDLSVSGLLGTVDGLLAEADTLLTDVGLLEDLGVELSTDAGAGVVCEITDPAIDLLGGLLGDDAATVCTDVATSVDDVIASVETQIDALAASLDDVLVQLQALLEAPLDVLQDQALLRLDGLDVTVLTEATDDVATSVAEVTGTLGGLQVGDLTLGALPLSSTTAQLDAVFAQAEGAVGAVLGQISPTLADLVSIRSLEETTSIVEDGEAIVSSADFTGLQVDVLPDIDQLLALLDTLGGVDSVGAQLEGLGLPVPTSGATEILELSSLLAGVPTDGLLTDAGVLALTEGLTVKVASLSQQSTFTPVVSPATPAAPAPAPQPTLPVTGSNDGLVLLLGAAAVLAALGGRQLLRRSA